MRDPNVAIDGVARNAAHHKNHNGFVSTSSGIAVGFQDQFASGFDRTCCEAVAQALRIHQLGPGSCFSLDSTNPWLDVQYWHQIQERVTQMSGFGPVTSRPDVKRDFTICIPILAEGNCILCMSQTL